VLWHNALLLQPVICTEPQVACRKFSIRELVKIAVLELQGFKLLLSLQDTIFQAKSNSGKGLNACISCKRVRLADYSHLIIQKFTPSLKEHKFLLQVIMQVTAPMLSSWGGS